MAEASDFSELRRLERDLARAADGIAPQVQGVMKNGAGKIKKQMVDELKASQYFKGVAPSISYDVNAERDAIEIEIGPDKARKGGALANIAYFGGSGWRGSVHTGGTVSDPQDALDAEAPSIDRYLGELLEDIL